MFDDEITRAIRHELAERPAQAIAAAVATVVAVIVGWVAYCVLVPALQNVMGVPR